MKTTLLLNDEEATRRLGARLGGLLPDGAVVALKVLRQWAGPYDVSPDGDAIVGRTPGLPGFVQVCGFTGHGFMMAPVVGKMLAAAITRGEDHPMLRRWNPARFSGGEPVRPREDMIIG